MKSEGNLSILLPSSSVDKPEVRSDLPTTLARREETVRRLVLLTVLYLVPGVQSIIPVTDPDIWWHLRTGQWIIEHGTVPVTDPFSSYSMGQPWVAYSWLFELLVYGLYRAFGLTGIVLYTVVLSLLIAFALHTFVRKRVQRFTTEVALTALGLCCIVPSLSPRPWLFTILFFIIELDMLFTARQTRDTRRLLFLPLLFMFWVNIHLQFVYGLFVLGLAAAEPVIEQVLNRFGIGNSPRVTYP